MKNLLKSTQTVLTEAIVVGIGLVILFNLIDNIFKYFKINYGMFFTLFISGFVFHIICEYIGLNLWYAKEYCKLIPSSL